MDELVKVINKVGAVRLGMMAAVVFGIILFFVFVTTQLSSGQMGLLYSDLSDQDRNAVIRELEASDVVYITSDDGNRIMVRSDDVGRVRMLLAEKGLPDGGSVGYELFDEEEGFSTTRFKQNLNKLRALEGELVRTITTLKPVDKARVHLVLPQRELFSRDEQAASASVFVELIRGKQLTEEQISAIQHMIAAAVPKLDPRRISIVDQEGNLLATGRGDDGATVMSQNIEKMRMSYELRLTRSVEDLVSSVVGFGKVRANVSVQMDFDRVATNSEIYDPEGQVIRSTQVSEEADKEFGGTPPTVTVENNLPGLPDDGAGGDLTRDSSRLEEITNFEISKTIRSHVREGGDVERLSVAVLVDGSYARDEAGEIQYTARSDDEMQKITELVRSAIGYDEDRGDTLEVINMRFADADILLEEPEVTAIFMGLTKEDIFRASETAILALVAMLVVLLVLRPMAQRIMSPEEAAPDETALLDEEMRPALSAPGMGTLEQELAKDDAEEDESMIDIKSIEGKVKVSTLKKVNEIIDNHPNEAISVLRSWMFQDS